jgi:hypothetical protein
MRYGLADRIIGTQGTGFNGARQKLQKRFQREPPFFEPGMGNFQIRFFARKIPEKQNINIQKTFTPAQLPGSIPAETGFNFMDTGEEFPGGAQVFPAGIKTRNRSIDKHTLIRYMEGGCFIKRSAAKFRQEFFIQGFYCVKNNTPGIPQV